MILFPNGIRVTKTEHKALLHLVVDPGDYIREALTEKARLRREALFTEWWARLSADPEVTTVPADSDALVTFIMARADFRTRVQQEEETAASEGLTFTMVNGNTDQYASKGLSGSMLWRHRPARCRRRLHPGLRSKPGRLAVRRPLRPDQPGDQEDAQAVPAGHVSRPRNHHYASHRRRHGGFDHQP